MDQSRRAFMEWVAASGGAAALLSKMGIASASEPSRLDLGSIGEGSHVLIIGGGIAGLTAAYELEKAGFSATLIEARSRLGGRNWTWREGTKVPHRSGEQTVAFAKGDYFNAGPARIPGFHHNILGYCRAFGVALEPFVYENQNAFVLSDQCHGGKPLRHRRARYSVQSAIEEVMLRALDDGTIASGLSAAEHDAVRIFMRLRTMRAGPFFAAWRGGTDIEPGAGTQMPSGLDPVPMAELARSPALAVALSTFDWVEWQTSLLQPVGGMDRIVDGFGRNIRAKRIMGAELAALEQNEAGVTAVLNLRSSGETRRISADHCILTAGLANLAECDLGLSPRHRRAIEKGALRYERTSKVAWQAKRRFWEEDDHVYGGSSVVDGAIQQFWYPSSGFGGRTGVLLGGYNVSKNADEWHSMSLEEQLSTSRGYGRRLHAAFDREVVAGYNIDWIDQPYSKGGWAWLFDEEMDADHPYRVLREGDGRVFFAGDYLTQLSGWQEGAVLSAHLAVAGIAQRKAAAEKG